LFQLRFGQVEQSIWVFIPYPLQILSDFYLWSFPAIP
jgi:hypothetical protein